MLQRSAGALRRGWLCARRWGAAHPCRGWSSAVPSRALSSGHRPFSLPTSSAAIAGVGSALGAGFLWASTMKPALAEEEGGKSSKDIDDAGVKSRVTEAYENRIRAFSAPEKVFALFASTHKNGEAQMNPQDFLRSLNPTRSTGKSSRRQQQAAKRLFQLVDLDGDGLISYHEYIFFMTMLSLPPSRFKVAFEMFDLDSSGSLDQKEFSSMIEVLKSNSTMGQSSRSDVVAASNQVKGTKSKAAQAGKGKYPVLFGKNGTKMLTYSRFASFLQQLQEDLVTLEFESFGPVDDSIAAADFATSLVSHVYPRQYKAYMKRIELIDPAHRVSYDDFIKFERMLSHLEDIEIAINTFSAAKGGFRKEHLLHASKVVAGVQLDPGLVDVIFEVFDEDRSGTLENGEFIAVMNIRRFHGASRRRCHRCHHSRYSHCYEQR